MRSSTGAPIWTAPAQGGRLLQIGGIGERVIVADEAKCSDLEDDEGRRVAFDAATGRVRWRVPGTGVATQSMLWMPASSADVAADGVVVTGRGRFQPGVTGLDARTGKRVWSLGPDLQSLGVSDHLVFSALPTSDGRLVLAANARRTGAPRWTFPNAPTDGWGDTFDVVAVDDDTVVVANGGYLVRYGAAPSGPTTFFVLDAETGTLRGSFGAADPNLQFSTMMLDGDVFVYGEGASVVARTVPDGTARWTHPFDGASGEANVPAVLMKSTTGTPRVLVEPQGTNRVVALDLVDGRERWSMVGVSVSSSGPSQTILGRRDGSRELIGVDTRSGKTRWDRRAPRSVATGRYATIGTEIAAGRLAVGQVCDSG